MCAAYSEELEQAKIHLSQAAAQDDSLAREVSVCVANGIIMSTQDIKPFVSICSDITHICAHCCIAQNAQLKQELLRMAHNQYALQEQLALATAAATSNASTAAATLPSATTTSSGVSSQSLYEDDDITALLQRYELFVSVFLVLGISVRQYSCC